MSRPPALSMRFKACVLTHTFSFRCSASLYRNLYWMFGCQSRRVLYAHTAEIVGHAIALLPACPVGGGACDVPWPLAFVHTLEAMLDPFAVQQSSNSTRMHATYCCFDSKRHCELLLEIAAVSGLAPSPIFYSACNGTVPASPHGLGKI